MIISTSHARLIRLTLSALAGRFELSARPFARSRRTGTYLARVAASLRLGNTSDDPRDGFVAITAKLGTKGLFAATARTAQIWDIDELSETLLSEVNVVELLGASLGSRSVTVLDAKAARYKAGTKEPKS